jgi:heterodisulfide reductase subunit B
MEVAAKKVLPEFDVELEDMPGVGCCPDPIGLKSIDFKTWLTLAARNLCIAEEMDLDIVTLCSGCASTLKKANAVLKEDGGLRQGVNEILSEIGKEFRGKVEVQHITQTLCTDIGLDKISGAVEREVKLRVAPYYGCHVIKPAEIMEFDKPETPRFLDDLLRAIGAEPIDYREKNLCCGSGVRTVNRGVALDVVNRILGNMVKAGADCLSFICPFCYIQLDIGQIELRREKKVTYNLPALYYLQLLGLAMEMRPEELGIYSHKIKPQAILEKIGSR